MDEAQLIAEARGWIADCTWADDVNVKALSTEQVKRGIQRHYDGGWAQFVKDGAP